MREFDLSSDIERIINNSSVTIFILKPEANYPVEFVTENVRKYGYSPEDFISGKLNYDDIIYSIDVERIHKELKELSKADIDNFILEYRIVTASGQKIWIESRTFIKKNSQGNIQYYETSILDINDRKISETILGCHNHVLETLASGSNLDEILLCLVKSTEKIIMDAICFVMLLDEKREYLNHIISSNLPDSYKKTITAIPIKDGIDACLIAALTGKKVIIEDLMHHPCWDKYKNILPDIELRASYCVPIISSNNEILGICGLHFFKPHKPTNEEIKIININSNLAAIAIKNKSTINDVIESEQKLKIILNNVNDQIYISELDGKSIAINQAVVDALGYSKEEFIGTYPTNVVPSNELQRVSKILKNIVNHGKAIYETEVISRNGKKIPLEISARFVIYDGKKSILSVARDISERKINDRERYLERERLGALLKLNDMTGTSLKEITDFAREEAVRLTESTLGYLAFMNADETTLIMHSWSENAMKECGIKDRHFIYPIKTTGLWGEAVRQRRPIITNDYDRANPMKKGYPEDHVKLTRHMNIPIIDGDNIVAVAGVGNKKEEYNESDLRQLTLLMQGMWHLIQKKQVVDALKQYSDELKVANAELRSLNRLKTEFITQKMKLIYTSENNIIDDETINVVNEQQIKAINSVLLNSEKLKRMINSLMYINEKQAGKIEYTFSSVKIDKILSEALMNLILLIDEKEILLKMDVPADMEPLKCDKEKMTAALIILIDNAIKFTPLKGKIHINVNEESGYLHLTITDTGPGIQKDLIPHVFQKFYQIDDSMSRMYMGLESGLYICKDIILAHHGEIWIESENGKGTTFHIKIPRNTIRNYKNEMII